MVQKTAQSSKVLWNRTGGGNFSSFNHQKYLLVNWWREFSQGNIVKNGPDGVQDNFCLSLIAKLSWQIINQKTFFFLAQKLSSITKDQACGNLTRQIISFRGFAWGLRIWRNAERIWVAYQYSLKQMSSVRFSWGNQKLQMSCPWAWDEHQISKSSDDLCSLKYQLLQHGREIGEAKKRRA